MWLLSRTSMPFYHQVLLSSNLRHHLQPCSPWCPWLTIIYWRLFCVATDAWWFYQIMLILPALSSLENSEPCQDSSDDNPFLQIHSWKYICILSDLFLLPEVSPICYPSWTIQPGGLKQFCSLEILHMSVLELMLGWIAHFGVLLPLTSDHFSYIFKDARFF